MSKASRYGSEATASAGKSELIPAVDRGGGRVAVSELHARRVWIAAGGRCTFCKEFLAEDETRVSLSTRVNWPTSWALPPKRGRHEGKVPRRSGNGRSQRI